MSGTETIHVVGGGAIGSALAALVTHEGRHVVIVRTSQTGIARHPAELVVRIIGGDEVKASVEMVSLDRLDRLDGIVAVTAKSYANPELAATLAREGTASPVVMLQNGLGVEESFVAAGFPEVHRCVVFVTSERQADGAYTFRSVRPSPVGIIKGSPGARRRIVEALNTPAFPFAEEERIQETIWTKVIINAVFNSICPLLETDNGIFDRNDDARALARGIIEEGVAVAKAAGMALDGSRILEQVLAISHGSSGQAISTLQDIRRGNPTEIASLNLAIARVGAEAVPPVQAERTEVLGRMIELKAALRRGEER